MKNIKDITLSIFAIIGFISIITAFNTIEDEKPEEQKITLGTPESHVFENIGVSDTDVYVILNKVTGEVTYHRTASAKKKENIVWNIIPIKTNGEHILPKHKNVE